MSPVWGQVAGIFIILMMVTFIGIWVWAWLPRHKRNFGRMSHLPMEDEDAPPGHEVPPTAPEDRK